jgi:hypothetical protein
VPKIIRKLPLFERVTTMPVPGGTVAVLPHQIVLSVSIAAKTERVPHPNTPRFPAVLDTAFNGGFLLQEEHLNQWAGLRREHLVPVDEITAFGRKVPVLRGNVWLHANVPGKRADAVGLRPFCIHLDPGIAVCSRGLARPRLPFLGLRALFLGDLQMSFHWHKLLFSLRTTPWWHGLFG